MSAKRKSGDRDVPKVLSPREEETVCVDADVTIDMEDANEAAPEKKKGHEEGFCFLTAQDSSSRRGRP
jgi:hypothetical protein